MKSYLMVFLLFLAIPVSAEEMRIHRGETYYIHLHCRASGVVKYAAEELAKYVNEVFHASCILRMSSLEYTDMLVFTARKTPKGCLIPVNKHPGEEGYYLSMQQNELVIFGGNGRGVLYGVYAFLEKYIGCRWYTSEVSLIPSLVEKRLPAVEESYTPVIRWREVFYYDLCDPDIAAKLKLNGNTLRKGLVAPERWAIQGGRHADWGLWCHSLYSLVSPELYESHPEYFSEVNGARIPPRSDGTQLCLTHPDLPELASASLRKLMGQPQHGLPVWANPLALYWSVSQMDGNGNCTCEQCRASDKYDGSPSGTMLKFVNKVAKRFPDKKIATLAYTYTRKAPLHTRPEPNVVIQMCAIETARQGINFPISTSAVHASFRRDLVEWGKICKEILVWDYVIQFQNLISPFPNFDVMKDNINFYVSNHVKAIFCQGNRERGGEFAELRGYLLSKLLWNPQCDVKAEMNDFLNGYYGKAGVYIKQYIERMQGELKKSGKVLSMDGEPESHRDGYLSEACIKEYNRLFDLAERAVAGDGVLLKRVLKERMPVMYAQIRLEYGSKEERKHLLSYIIQLAEENRIWMFSEVDNREDQSGNREMFHHKFALKLNQRDM